MEEFRTKYLNVTTKETIGMSKRRLYMTNRGVSISTISILTGQMESSEEVSTQDVSLLLPDDRTPAETKREIENPIEGTNSNEETEGKSKICPFVQKLLDEARDVWQEDPGSELRGLRQEQCERVFEDLLADTAQLERILIARKYDINDSLKLLFEQVRFRVRWKPKEIRPAEITNALRSGAWRLCGKTKDGIVISNYKLQYWKPGDLGGGRVRSKAENLESAVLEYTKFVVYMMELMISCMGPSPKPQKFLLIFDLKGFSSSLVWRRDVRLMVRKLIYVAQGQYPERLHRVMLTNAPYGFEAAWKLIQPMLDEKTASKIHFLRPDKLSQEIDLDVLSEEYGGRHTEYPLPGGF